MEAFKIVKRLPDDRRVSVYADFFSPELQVEFFERKAVSAKIGHLYAFSGMDNARLFGAEHSLYLEEHQPHTFLELWKISCNPAPITHPELQWYCLEFRDKYFIKNLHIKEPIEAAKAFWDYINNAVDVKHLYQDVSSGEALDWDQFKASPSGSIFVKDVLLLERLGYWQLSNVKQPHFLSAAV